MGRNTAIFKGNIILFFSPLDFIFTMGKKRKHPLDKPDYEDDLFRLWDNEKAKEKAKDYEGVSVHYKGLDVKLTGFTIARMKENDKMVFAYKFKHGEKQILWFCPENEDLTDKEKDDLAKMVLVIEAVGVEIGYSVQNMADSFEEMIKSEKLNKYLNRKKKENGSKK